MTPCPARDKESIAFGRGRGALYAFGRARWLWLGELAYKD